MCTAQYIRKTRAFYEIGTCNTNCIVIKLYFYVMQAMLLICFDPIYAICCNVFSTVNFLTIRIRTCCLSVNRDTFDQKTWFFLMQCSRDIICVPTIQQPPITVAYSTSQIS
eukprot:NODE_671_length_5354_cov_0.091722.p6 type:complete len:111 gc:universal NODE_671_length_5354_cov_0.091722:4720-5052(+)